MKYRANASDTWHKIKVKALDGMPVGTIVDYDGQASDIPAGWETYGTGQIKKTSETTPTMASIVNEINTSTKDAYSCKFITDNFNGNRIYSQFEVNTGKIWMDNKPIYRKVIENNFTTSGTEIRHTLSSIGLDNIETIVELNSFSQGNPMEQDYYSSSTDQLRTLINENGLSVIVGSSYPVRPCTVYTIIEYTKTTD